MKLEIKYWSWKHGIVKREVELPKTQNNYISKKAINDLIRTIHAVADRWVKVRVAE